MGEVMLAEEEEVNGVKLDTKKDVNKFLKSKVFIIFPFLVCVACGELSLI
jgi:hypothetical protein